jgi:hypothetical protein
VAEKEKAADESPAEREAREKAEASNEGTTSGSKDIGRDQTGVGRRGESETAEEQALEKEMAESQSASSILVGLEPTVIGEVDYVHEVCGTAGTMDDRTAFLFYTYPWLVQSLFCSKCAVGIRIGEDGEMSFAGGGKVVAPDIPVNLNLPPPGAPGYEELITGQLPIVEEPASRREERKEDTRR